MNQIWSHSGDLEQSIKHLQQIKHSSFWPDRGWTMTSDKDRKSVSDCQYPQCFFTILRLKGAKGHLKGAAATISGLCGALGSQQRERERERSSFAIDRCQAVWWVPEGNTLSSKVSPGWLRCFTAVGYQIISLTSDTHWWKGRKRNLGFRKKEKENGC